MIANLFVCAYLRKILHICSTHLFIVSRICLYINVSALYPFFIALRIYRYNNASAHYPSCIAPCICLKYYRACALPVF